MANELAIPEGGALSKYSTDEAFAKIASSSFLGRVQVMGSQNNEVKEGKFPIGHFALVNGSSFTDLTTEFECWLLSWRPKAMQFQPDVQSFYNPESAGFKSIQARSEQPNSGCGWGGEFLLWIPEQEKFVTFFLGNATGRRELGNIKAFLHKACTFKIKYIKGKKNSWHGCEVANCATELSPPPEDKYNEEMAKFNNPPEVETVEAADVTTQER